MTPTATAHKIPLLEAFLPRRALTIHDLYCSDWLCGKPVGGAWYDKIDCDHDWESWQDYPAYVICRRCWVSRLVVDVDVSRRGRPSATQRAIAVPAQRSTRGVLRPFQVDQAC